MTKEIQVPMYDAEYEIYNEFMFCGDCDHCPAKCELGMRMLSSRIGVGA